MARRSGGGMGPARRLRAARAPAAWSSGEQRVTFKDVAGIDEAKAELLEVVDFLKNPDRYQRLGGRIPRGVLLAGQPGTGKTLLARAVAGEAGVPFFSISASEFVEAIVGVGAAPRARPLQAGQGGRARRSSSSTSSTPSAAPAPAAPASASGSNDEREQTLNQILTEMDGFESDATVIVLGRDQPAGGARLRAAAARAASTAASPSRRRTSTAAAASSRSTPARCRSTTTSTSNGSPR